MKVTVRDRSAEGAWGSGPINPCVVTVEIADNCPVADCGARRGEPRHLRQVDDGAWYSVQVWDNPCGHVDMYEDVVKEAKALAARDTEAAPTVTDMRAIFGEPVQGRDYDVMPPAPEGGVR